MGARPWAQRTSMRCTYRRENRHERAEGPFEAGRRLSFDAADQPEVDMNPEAPWQVFADLETPVERYLQVVTVRR